MLISFCFKYKRRRNVIWHFAFLNLEKLVSINSKVIKLKIVLLDN
ncbi:MAG: hypothetical protein ACTS46_02085 [Candidatus Hodgkinia cicadicola]